MIELPLFNDHPNFSVKSMTSDSKQIRMCPGEKIKRQKERKYGLNIQA